MKKKKEYWSGLPFPSLENIPILTANKVLLKARSITRDRVGYFTKIFSFKWKNSNSKFIYI